MTSSDRELLVKPVRIPLTRGLLGYRICIIKKGKEDIFRDIQEPQEIIDKEITIGLGESWPDTRIVESSGIRVETVEEYSHGFKSLLEEEFDCFSRGVNEVFTELEKREQKFTDDKYIYLKYDSPIYFFVSVENDELAERIHKGLNRAINNGNFDCIFSHYFADDIARANLSKRTQIELKNYDLPNKSPLEHLHAFEKDPLPDISQKKTPEGCQKLTTALKENRIDTSSIKLPLKY